MTTEDGKVMAKEVCRSTFEKWMSFDGKFPGNVLRRDDGYVVREVDTAWAAWRVTWIESRRSALKELEE